MAMAEGLAALTSIKTLYEFAREMRDSNDPEKLRASARQMFDLAISAREQVAILQEQRNSAVIELATLKAEVEKMNRFDDEAKNYTRERTHSGATIYREKDSAGPQGHSPYYCPNCFGNKRISILNPAPGANTAIHTFDHMCGTCRDTMPLPRLGAGSVPRQPVKAKTEYNPFHRK